MLGMKRVLVAMSILFDAWQKARKYAYGLQGNEILTGVKIMLWSSGTMLPARWLNISGQYTTRMTGLSM
jgi:hypothetical protein